MKEVEITYNDGNGHMKIYCDNFFPAPQGKLKQLLKIVDMDYKNRDEILKKFYTHCIDAKLSCDETMSGIRTMYSQKYQKMCDMQRMVDTCKHPPGLPLTKLELHKAKIELKDLKQLVRELEQDFKEAKKDSAKLKVNAEIVYQHIEMQ
jgi:hypothetical protein